MVVFSLNYERIYLDTPQPRSISLAGYVLKLFKQASCFSDKIIVKKEFDSPSPPLIQISFGMREKLSH